MGLSVFDFFTIGIGPSSSHTIGPMRAANEFVSNLSESGLLDSVTQVHVVLYGSLGATGKGHGSDTAILLGLEGSTAEEVDVNTISERIENIISLNSLNLNNEKEISFNFASDLILHQLKTLPYHSNGMTFAAKDVDDNTVLFNTFYSIGGGFIVNDDVLTDGTELIQDIAHERQVKYPFDSAEELLALCRKHNLSICELMLENEQTWRTVDEIKSDLLKIWHAMQKCVQRGCEQTGILPGGLKVKRRAASLYQSLQNMPEPTMHDPLSAMDWINLYALAVNEENASGGRVVTAPTNGAAGIIPAVMHYYEQFVPGADEEGIIQFLLTAGAIGMLFKKNASISGAEVGCQGEVGSASSMASAGLAQVLGGTPEQIENAAEIAMEHNLGLTCDPVAGLVQVPCIERNAMASVKAINAARLAMRGDGTHLVSLDQVIKTMRETGADMQTKYKETSLGGLAVNITAC